MGPRRSKGGTDADHFVRYFITVTSHKLHGVLWWRHRMKTFPRYWHFVRGILQSPVNFSSQRPVTRRFNVFFDVHLNKRLSKQPRYLWFGMPLRSLWRHCNGFKSLEIQVFPEQIVQSNNKKYNNSGFLFVCDGNPSVISLQWDSNVKSVFLSLRHRIIPCDTRAGIYVIK